MKIIIHGGHTNDINFNDIEINNKLNEILKNSINKNPTDAVLYAVKEMENSPLFNAGIGSVKRTNGEILMDASFATNNYQGEKICAGVAGVKLPNNASQIAFQNAVNKKNIVEYFHDNKTNNNLNNNTSKLNGDTVGAIAVNNNIISLCSSTGGLINVPINRISDVPISGCGYYLANKGAILATGDGDAFIKTNACRIAGFLLDLGIDIKKCIKYAIKLIRKENGSGSIIIVDLEGNIEIASEKGKLIYVSNI